MFEPEFGTDGGVRTCSFAYKVPTVLAILCDHRFTSGPVLQSQLGDQLDPIYIFKRPVPKLRYHIALYAVHIDVLAPHLCTANRSRFLFFHTVALVWEVLQALEVPRPTIVDLTRHTNLSLALLDLDLSLL